MGKHVKIKRNVQDVAIEEVLKAMAIAGKWVTKKLHGNPVYGPFSEALLGDKAAVLFPKLAYCKLAGGEWEWKDGLSLTTQLIRIIRTEMSHRYRDWKNRKEPEPAESLSDEMIAVEAEEALACESESEDESKELGYQLITRWLKDYPELLRYVQLVEELNDYRAISKRLRIRMSEVKALEAETVRVIAEARKRLCY